MARVDNERELPMPFGGLSEDLAKSKQNLATTGDAESMRGQDPTNGRERIAQRSGMSKANETAVQPGIKVAEMASVVFDSRNLTYSDAAGAEEEVWKVKGPGKKPVLMGETDRFGNVYITDGAASVAKLNPDGKVIWQIPLPVKDDTHSIRFVHVDDVLDVYAGVSFGSPQNMGRLWKLKQLPDDEVEVAWEVELDAYVEIVKVRQDKLYTLQNEPDVKRSYIRIYDQLDAAAPRLSQEIRVSYPGNDFDVKDDGSIFVASDYSPAQLEEEAFVSQRAPNPKFPHFAPEAEDLVLGDMTDLRVWSDYDPDKITEFDVAGELVNDVKLIRLPDSSGHGRHLYAATSIGMQPPLVRLEGLNSHVVINFNGLDQALISLPNSSTKKQYADQQKTALPGYEGSMFCSILVIRPEKRDTGDPMWVFWQDNSAPGALDHILIANRSDGSALPGTFASGVLSHYSATDAGDPGRGTNAHPKEGSFNNENDLAIVVILWDGGIDPNDTTVTRSLFQINGQPIDRYEGLGNFTKQATIFGFGLNPSSGFTNFEGDLVRWINLDRRNREDDVTEPKILTHDQLEDTDAVTFQTDNELTRIVGYLAHKYGCQHLLGDDVLSQFPHPYGLFSLVPGDARSGPPLDGPTGAHAKTENEWALLAKYSPQGDLVWATNETDDDGTDAIGAIGWGVRVASDGNVYSFGPDTVFHLPSGSAGLRKVIDQGETFSHQAADGAWRVGLTAAYAYPRMVVDEHDNVYVPIFSSLNALQVYKSDGTLLADVNIGTPGRSAHAVAIDPKVPDYGDDLTNPLARFVYVFTENGDDPEIDTIYKIRLVLESPLAGSPRELVHVAIAGNGEIRTFVVDGAMATPTGASGKLVATAPYIQAVTAFEKVYITDGVSPIAVYDPREDTVTVLESTSPGAPPHGAKILELWSGRIVAARAAQLVNGSFNWIMSKHGDPTNWDTFPASGSPAAAIGGESAGGPGMVPDIVNCFIPIDDDYALWGCDHSIWLMAGDPGDGGIFDNVSELTGIAFGRPWCKDPEGRVWFVGSRGGLFLYPPGGRPERVSLHSFDRRLQDINFGTHYVKLAWNDEDQTVHILRFRFGDPSGVPLEHWVWDAKRGAPWPDKYGTSAEPEVDPTAVHVIDGDGPEDRMLVYGCRDGFIRKWDKDAFDDDGVAINARIRIGPLVGPEYGREYRFMGPRAVLATEHAGCLFELYSTDDPSNPGPPRYVGQLAPGRNGLKHARMRGSHCFVAFKNAVAGQRFAIEEAAMAVSPAGLKRVRESL